MTSVPEHQDPPTRGVPADLAHALDFIMVRPALVDLLGGAADALVWARIHWRCQVESKSTVMDEHDVVWWPAGRDTIMAETGLTSDQARRAIERLLAGGFIDSTEHRLGGNYDRTKSYRPVVAEPGHSARPSGRPRPHEQAQAPDVPLPKTSEDERGAEVLVSVPSDAEKLCEILADCMVATGVARPKITKAWVTAADRLMRLDGYTFRQAEWVLRWSQQDSFWHTNILSMPTLREKFDQLKLKAQAEHAERTRPAARQRPSRGETRDNELLDFVFGDDAAPTAAPQKEIESWT
jgi:hypothetical protein